MEHNNEFEEFICRPKFPRSQSNHASVGCAEQTVQSQLTGLKGSVVNILASDTTAHLQGTSGLQYVRTEPTQNEAGGHKVMPDRCMCPLKCRTRILQASKV